MERVTTFDALPAGPAAEAADRPATSSAEFTRRVLTVLAIGAVAALAIGLTDLLLLLFASVLVAIVLQSLAELLTRTTGLSHRWSLTLVTTLLALLLVGGIWGFGAQVYAQVNILTQALPTSFDKLRDRFSDYPQVQKELDQLRSFDVTKMAGGVLPPAFRALSTVFGVVVDIVLIIFFGLYIAAEPQLYRWGLLSLVPPARRTRAGQVMDEIRTELRHWLNGQVVAMAVVGVLAAIGLGLSGVAAWPALAIVTGLSEFIPILGPLTAAVPCLLVAFAGGTTETLWVAATFLIIHEFESSVLVPLIQRRAASLPPLLSLGALAGAGILLGLPGLVFATPLAVSIMVLVRMLYIEDVLGGAAPKPREMK